MNSIQFNVNGQCHTYILNFIFLRFFLFFKSIPSHSHQRQGNATYFQDGHRVAEEEVSAEQDDAGLEVADDAVGERAGELEEVVGGDVHEKGEQRREGDEEEEGGGEGQQGAQRGVGERE